MAKRKPPVASSGGRGFGFEDEVAAWYLVDLLSGSRPFNGAIGRVEEIRWQNQDSGWLFDDLVLVGDNGIESVQAGFSIKLPEHLNSAGFDKEIVEQLWKHFHGNDCRQLGKSDLLCLAVGEIGREVLRDWRSLMRQLSDTSTERMLVRLTPDSDGKNSQSSSNQRKLLKSLADHSSLTPPPKTEQAIELLRQVRVIAFDFEDEAARDRQLAVERCQRLVNSNSYEDAERLWDELVRIASILRPKGGDTRLEKSSTSRSSLLDRLTGFSIRDAIDYEQNLHLWQEKSRAHVATCDAAIGGESIERAHESVQITNSIDSFDITLIAGPTGAGKSSLANAVCESKNLVPLLLDESFFSEEMKTGITEQVRSSTIGELLNASGKRTLLILDSLETWEQESLNKAAAKLNSLEQHVLDRHSVALICQPQAIARVANALARIDGPLPNLVRVSPPVEEEVKKLISKLPHFDGFVLSELPLSLFQNLKVLELTNTALAAGAQLNLHDVDGESGLGDLIWQNWIEKNGNDYSASGLLQRIGDAETEQLASGVTIRQLESAHHGLIPDLVVDGLLVKNDERVIFSHDVVANWARLRILIGEPQLLVEKAKNFRWHSAIRMFATREVELRDDSSWFFDMYQSKECSATLRELLLDGVVLAIKSANVNLQQHLDFFCGQGEEHVRRFLSRFEHQTTTLIESQVPWIDSKLLSGVSPFWSNPDDCVWLRFLTTVAKHKQTMEVAADKVAELCDLVLTRHQQGNEHATELVDLAAANAIKTAKAIFHNEDKFDSDSRKKIYGAFIRAADIEPDEVGRLLLQLAKRRQYEKPRPAEEADHDFSDLPEEAKELLNSPFNRYEPEPWPDGPFDQIDTALRDVVLFSDSLVSLMKLAPDVAEEVLLACCIEDPPNKATMMFGREEGVCLYHSIRHESPLFDTGSFQKFFEISPDHAVSFLIRLVNFATERWSEYQSERVEFFGTGTDDDLFARQRPDKVKIPIGGEWKTWVGDYHVYRWGTVPVRSGDICTAALMAFEAWIYKIGAEDCKPYLERVLREAKSTAFAGVLVDIGKKYVELFYDTLQPLLGCWPLFSWDRAKNVESSNFSPAMMRWSWRENPVRRGLAQAWHEMEHRKTDLMAVGTFMLAKFSNHRDFMKKCISVWENDLNSTGRGHPLDLYLVLLDWSNYRITKTSDGKIEVQFVEPDALQKKNAEILGRSNDTQLSIRFPFSMRKLLNTDAELSEEQLAEVWAGVDHISRMADEHFADHRPASRHDSLTGAAAVLLCRASIFLESDSSKQEWCRNQFEQLFNSPPPPEPFDSAQGRDDHGWRAFMVDIAVAFLKRDPNDEVAMLVIAESLMAHQYFLTEHTLQKLRDNRQHLPSKLLGRAFRLSLNWSAIRTRIDRIGSWAERFRYKREKLPDGTEIEPNPFQEREIDDAPNETRDKLADAYKNEILQRDLLIEAFVFGKPVEFDVGRMIDDSIRQLEAIEADTNTRMFWREETSFARDQTVDADIGLSPQVMMHCANWIDLRLCSNHAEQKEWNAHISVLNKLQIATSDVNASHFIGYSESLGIFETNVHVAQSRAIIHCDLEDIAAKIIRELLDGFARSSKTSNDSFCSFFRTFFAVTHDDQPDPQRLVSRWFAIIEAMQSRDHSEFSVTFWAAALFPNISSGDDNWLESVALGIKERSESYLEFVAEKFQRFSITTQFATAMVSSVFRSVRLDVMSIIVKSELPTSPDRVRLSAATAISRFLSKCWACHENQILSSPKYQDDFLTLLSKCRELDQESVKLLEKDVLEKVQNNG